VSVGLLGCNAILGADEYRVDGSSAGGTGGTSSGGSGPSGPGGAGAGSVGGASSGGNDPGGGGSGGGMVDPCDLPDDQKTIVDIEGDIGANFTLTCDKRYKLKGEVFVTSGATLTIQAGTVIYGEKTTGGALIVTQGSQLVANGTAEKPIVFTSFATTLGPEFAAAGDWGGVVLLGRAPTNIKDAGGTSVPGVIEGVQDADPAKKAYGGNQPGDSSGSLQYVRIEYCGTAVAPNNELNGLTFGGVGSGTIVDHIQVRKTTDDCYEFFGGTVRAKHLICQAPGDDSFDWDYGFTGKLQFLVTQQDPSFQEVDADYQMNGIEADNEPSSPYANTPLSEPTIYNATLCGHNYPTAEQVGILLRRGTLAHLFNFYVNGFETGWDMRNGTGPQVEIESSVFFGNVAPAQVETMAPFTDDDAMFDELAYLGNAANQISLADPGIPGCAVQNTLELKPSAPITTNAATPPNDGFFDTTANFIGAFRDTNDDWATGNWVRWSTL
jgi:hypothetical protein